MPDNISTPSISFPSQERVPKYITEGKSTLLNGSNTIHLASSSSMGKRANVYRSYLNTAKPVTLSSLPPELPIEIFKPLHTTDTVCLALTTTNSWAIFKGAFSGLFPIRFRAMNEGILQQLAFQNLLSWIGPTVFGFDSPISVLTKERHDKFFRLQKAWEINQQVCREVQETMGWIGKQVSGVRWARTGCNLVSKGALSVSWS
jgi:hypothetical protein